MTTKNNNSENKRKYKSKSLVIPTIISSADDFCENNCDTSPSSFKSRFSFRRNNSRRRGKSLCRFTDDSNNDDFAIAVNNDKKINFNCNKNDKLNTNTLPLCQSTRNKSASLVDLKNACNNFYRHLTTNNGKTNFCCRGF